MGFAAPRSLFVPAGTAAAVIASETPHADPQLEGRRWAHVATLTPEVRVEALHGLVASGVYTRIEDQVVVVRIVRDGARTLAAIVADTHVTPANVTPAGAPIDARVAVTSAELEQALLSATRTRPLFHGTSPDGSTLSGFIPEDQDAILAAIEAGRGGLGTTTPARSSASGSAEVHGRIIAVFAGASATIPPGLVVAG